MHLNICHLTPKIDQLSYLMYDHYKCKIDICGISETFLNQQQCPKKPIWLTHEIINEMQHRDRLKANCLWEEYKKQKSCN